MKQVPNMLIVALIVGTFFLWPDAPALQTVFPPETAPLLRIDGHVSYQVRPTRTLLLMNVDVSKGGRPVSDWKISLMGQPAQANDPGNYGCEILGFSASAGQAVTVTFAAPGMIATEEHPPLKASATVGSPVQFSAPTADAHILHSSAGNLQIAWSGGVPPYRVLIMSFTGSDPNSSSWLAKVFERNHVARTTLAVPMSTFTPGTMYGIYVHSIMDTFRFKEKVDPASDFKLIHNAATFFHID